MLSLHAVNQFYGENHILWNINLELFPGECACVIGAPGMGKTTLMNCITGHVPVRSGSIIWQGADGTSANLLDFPAESRTRLGIAHLPGERRVFSQLSVEENLHIAMLAGTGANKAVPSSVYELFPALYGLRHERSAGLTESQLQQLALARVLVTTPELLILDEPAKGNSQPLIQEMGKLIRRINRELGITILLVEQHLSFIRWVADRFFLLHRGRNVVHGDISHLNGLQADWMEP